MADGNVAGRRRFALANPIHDHALQARLAKWQLPDDVLFVDELPVTATGKIDKKVLRNRFGDHLINSKASEETLREGR